MSNVSTEFEPPSATTRPPVGFHQEYSGVCLKRAKQVMPQGVGSPGRAFDQVAASPIFVSNARGSRIWDVDGNVLVDFMNGLGPMILGHANDAVRSEEHTSELQSLVRISYAVFCLKNNRT